MKRLIIVAFLLLAVTSFAQVNYQLSSAVDFVRTYKIASGEYYSELTEKDIQGSPFLNQEFINGSVYTTNKFQYADIPLRYNIFNDNIEFKTPENKILAIAAPETIDKITFGDYTIEYVPYTNVKKARNGYMLLITKGKASLYAKPEVFYQKPTEAGAYKEPEPAKFERRSDAYYIRIETAAAQRIDNKKDLIETFPNHQKELEAFVKKNKINPAKEDALKSLVEYYNSL
ncbi:hypothetical protein D1614_15755 [Maribellus luteus]|uniref:GLPGLI family protein n=1 Tax=Maribellus luteus TaxID=2305463 RepID=A0A399SYT8_9BACT|nr:hypothetical protein [Maribellus luteus]RIJ47211.1 hypothetical protein D1614_15755 [Maribellus luteus]